MSNKSPGVSPHNLILNVQRVLGNVRYAPVHRLIESGKRNPHTLTSEDARYLASVFLDAAAHLNAYADHHDPE